MCGRLSWTHSAFESTSNSTIVPYRIVSYGFSYEVNSAVSSYSPHLVLALQTKPEMRICLPPGRNLLSWIFETWIVKILFLSRNILSSSHSHYTLLSFKPKTTCSLIRYFHLVNFCYSHLLLGVLCHLVFVDKPDVIFSCAYLLDRTVMRSIVHSVSGR